MRGPEILASACLAPDLTVDCCGADLGYEEADGERRPDAPASPERRPMAAGEMTEDEAVELSQVSADVGSQAGSQPRASPAATDDWQDAVSEASDLPDSRTAAAEAAYGRWDCCFVLAAPEWHAAAASDEEGGVARTARVEEAQGLIASAQGELSGLLKRPRASMSLDDLLLRLTASGLDHACYKSVQGDEIYVKVRASLGRLRRHAEATGARYRLAEKTVEQRARKGFPRLGIKGIHIGEECRGMKMSEWRPYEHIYAKYDRHPDLAGLYDVPPSERATGWPFSSMMRIKLIWDLLHEKRRNGGCELDIDELVYHGDLLAFLALHDAPERRRLYEAFCHMSPLKPPSRLPLDRYMGYFGEMHGLRMAFTAHITTAYYLLALVGLAVFVETVVVKDSGTEAVVAYSFLLVVWSIVTIEDWKRTQAAISVMWGTRGYENREKPRPQHRGYLVPSPINGESEVWYPPFLRRRAIRVSAVIVAFMVLMDIVFLTLVFYIKAVQPGVLHNISHQYFVGITALVNAAGIQLFYRSFRVVGVWATDRENWRTETAHHDALTQKLFYFYIVNFYVPLFYLTFVQYYNNPFVDELEARGCKKSDGAWDCEDIKELYATVAEQVLGELRTSLAIILSSALLSSCFSRFVMPYLKEVWRKHSEGGLSVPMSVPELQYVLAEYDELQDTTVDYMLTTMQYGYIVLFSSAFPGAPVVALVVNNVQMRVDGFSFIHLYRRVMPASAEDIGVFEGFFQMLNVAGIVTNTAISVYVSDTFNRRAGYTNHHRDTLFIVAMTAWLTSYAALRLVIEDVPRFVVIQMKRTEFIDAKIIDKVPDTPAHETLKVATIDYRVSDSDDGPYVTDIFQYKDDDHVSQIQSAHDFRDQAADEPNESPAKPPPVL